MITFRCPERVRRRLRLRKAKNPEQPIGTFSEWYVESKRFEHCRYTLLFNPATCICLVMPEEEFAANSVSITQYLRGVLLSIGVPQWKISEELNVFDSCQYTEFNSVVVEEYFEQAWYFISLMLFEGDDCIKASSFMTMHRYWSKGTEETSPRPVDLVEKHLNVLTKSPYERQPKFGAPNLN